ncbi:MAG: hypothetical protein AAF662_06410 [Pseudomonadota bacterium]
MQNLLLLLVAIFVGVGLMVFILERFAKPTDPETVAKLSRWLIPLVGIMLVLGALKQCLPAG